MAWSHSLPVPFPAHFRRSLGWKSLLWGGGLTVLAVVLGYIPARLTLARRQVPTPQAILTLGGRSTREAYAARLGQRYPQLEIWVSSGLEPDQAQGVFGAAGIVPDRLHLDYRAVDTVTNFTTLVDDLERHQIRHIYLVTSDYHMPRATAIATVVLGSRGIAFTPVIVPSHRPTEAPIRTARDVTRSLLWWATGYTGADLKPKFRQPAPELEETN